MNLLIAILIVGLSGIIAQIIILRELLVNFHGNELTIGIILANWMVAEALGVFSVGKLVERIRAKLNVFILLNILFASILPFGVYLSRIIKLAVGIPFAEAVSLPVIFSASFLIVLPLAFLHGALFSSGAKLFSIIDKRNSLGRIYTWETLGTILGGVVLTYLLIPNSNSFQSVIIVSYLNFILISLLLTNKKLRYFLLVFFTLMFVLFSQNLSSYLQNSSIHLQWKGQKVLDYRNSNYANVTVTKKFNQYTFFYNGIPVITTPYPDKQFVIEFGNFPFLFNSSNKKVLIAGSGSGGLIAEALRYPIEHLDYVEIDPLIMDMLKHYPTTITERELKDKRVKVINTDARLFLNKNNVSYDCILLGLSEQSDLTTNRLFTEEFFTLAKKRLSSEGLIALWMPGSLTYMSQDLKDLNSCVLNGLKSVFKFVRVIPGDYNIFIASDSSQVLQVTPQVLTQRMLKYGIPTGIFVPEYLEYRLKSYWVNWFNQELFTATKGKNLDLRPIAVYQRLKIENKKFSPQFDYLFGYFKFINIKSLFLIVLVLTFILFCFAKLRNSSKISLTYVIFTTGFFGMSINLLLIFAYQVFYGYLYQKISMLTAIFMAGIAFGSFLMVKKLSNFNNPKAVLIKLEGLIAIFTLILGFIVLRFASLLSSAVYIFYLALFGSGMLMGLEFPLVGKLYLGNKNTIGTTSGVLYASDLIGGWLAGIFTGVLFLPVLGLFNTCLLIVLVKISSLLLFLSRGHPSS